MADTATPTITEPSTIVTPTATPKPWYDGKLDDSMLAYVHARGLAGKEPIDVALSAIKGHIEANKLLGVGNRDELVRWPRSTEDERWKDVYARLGVPTKPEEYDLSPVKFADGTEIEPEFQDFLRNTASTLHLPKQAALEFAQALVKNMEAAETAENAERTALIEAGRAELRKDWGANWDANMFIARRGAEKMGVSAQAVNDLENAVGYKDVMNLFFKIGRMSGEDKFVSSTGQDRASGVMTREEAVAKKAELMSDEIWTKKYLGGDRAALREMQALNSIIVGGVRA